MFIPTALVCLESQRYIHCTRMSRVTCRQLRTVRYKYHKLPPHLHFQDNTPEYNHQQIDSSESNHPTQHQYQHNVNHSDPHLHPQIIQPRSCLRSALEAHHGFDCQTFSDDTRVGDSNNMAVTTRYERLTQYRAI